MTRKTRTPTKYTTELEVACSREELARRVRVIVQRHEARQAAEKPRAA